MPVLDFTLCVLSKRQEGASDDLCFSHPLCLPSKRGGREVGRGKCHGPCCEVHGWPQSEQKGDLGKVEFMTHVL